jgi:hypothetical protein
VTNSLGQIEQDFDMGEADGTADTLAILGAIARRISSWDAVARRQSPSRRDMAGSARFIDEANLGVGLVCWFNVDAQGWTAEERLTGL